MSAQDKHYGVARRDLRAATGAGSLAVVVSAGVAPLVAVSVGLVVSVALSFFLPFRRPLILALIPDSAFGAAESKDMSAEDPKAPEGKYGTGSVEMVLVGEIPMICESSYGLTDNNQNSGMTGG